MVRSGDRTWGRREFLTATTVVGISSLAGCGGTDQTPATSSADPSTTEQAEQQPGLAVQDSSISSDQLVIGTELSVSAVVENSSSESRTFDIAVAVVDKHKEVSVTLDPGERADVSMTAAPMTVGDGEIRLNSERLGTVQVVPAASENDRTVGAHYFSWYGRDPHTWRDGEWSLESPFTPTLGNYDARDPAVIEQHIDWCHYAGIQWLNAVWTGPDSPIDKNLKNHILTHPRADELDWSIFYDTLIIHDLSDDDVTSVDLSDEETAATLKDHVAYVADQYFGREYYKTIDDRPVFYTWIGGAYTGEPATVFTEAFDDAGVDPYFIVGTGGRSINETELAEIADAVTTYNPYRPREDIEEVFLDQMESTYRSWYLTAEKTGHDVIPTAIPGFNDSDITHVFRDNPVLELSTDRYANACEVGHKYAEGPIFVTAFNEWYESQFIEPSEEFGMSFLDITAESLAVEEWEPPIDPGSIVTLSFEEIVPATELAPGTDDDRRLTMRLHRLSIFNDGELIREIDVGGPEQGIDFIQGYFAPESDPDGDTARWLGGQPESTLFFEGVTEIDRIEIMGWASTEMPVTATVDEELLGTTQVSKRHDTYTIR